MHLAYCTMHLCGAELRTDTYQCSHCAFSCLVCMALRRLECANGVQRYEVKYPPIDTHLEKVHRIVGGLCIQHDKNDFCLNLYEQHTQLCSCSAGASVQVRLGSLDGRHFTAKEEAQQAIWFGDVAVGATQHRVLRVCNPTPLPLPFCWQQTDDPVSPGKPCILLQTQFARVGNSCTWLHSSHARLKKPGKCAWFKQV